MDETMAKEIARAEKTGETVPTPCQACGASVDIPLAEFLRCGVDSTAARPTCPFCGNVWSIAANEEQSHNI